MRLLEKVKNNAMMQKCAGAKTAIGVVAQTALMATSLVSMSFAAGDNTGIVDKITDLFSGVYGTVVSLASITAAILCVFALIFIGVSKDEKKGAVAISWIKRIVICWFAIIVIVPLIQWIGGIIGSAGNISDLKQTISN